jgi:hypothetical protein
LEVTENLNIEHTPHLNKNQLPKTIKVLGHIYG